MNLGKIIAIGLLIYGVKKEIEQNSAYLTDTTDYRDLFGQINIKDLLDKAFDAAFKKQESILADINDGLLLEQQQFLLLPQPDLNAIEASKWLPLIKHPSVIVILGKRGSGKSALAYRLIELMKWIAPVYVVGLPSSAHKDLPDWIEVQPKLEDIPLNSIILLDESYIQYHARLSMTSQAKELSQILNLSRQRGQTLIFVSQESNQIDRNIFSAIDVIIFKEPSMFQAKFDRPELRELSSQAEKAFQSIPGDKKKWAFVFSQERGCVGFIESLLPSFWSNKLSRAFASTEASRPILGKKLARSERQAEVKRLAALGNKPAQIARIMGLSKATIKNYLEDYPYR